MAASEKVFKAGVKREQGWLYYLDKNCNIARSRMVRGGQRKKKGDRPEVVVKTDISRREDGYLYFISRKDEMIKTSGYRVSPTEVEEVVYDSGLVAGAALLLHRAGD